jgi:hypothetical protein
VCNSFHDLVQKYGTPFLVVRNCPTITIDGTKRRKVLSRGPQIGTEPFLLIRADIEILRRGAAATAARLIENGYPIVRYYLWFGYRLWTRDRVRLTLAEDVRPISEAELYEAADKRRLLYLSYERSMGDGYIDFQIADRSGLPWAIDYSPYLFLFPSSEAIPDAELPGYEFARAYDSPDEFFHAHRSYFTREMPAPRVASGPDLALQ